ncbi:MAG: hypothetical protein KTU85_10285, partial [Acidimicrobiia bacterium]|nr:hypothetical protein [Acidimicrobiia bacterium]
MEVVTETIPRPRNHPRNPLTDQRDPICSHRYPFCERGVANMFAGMLVWHHAYQCLPAAFLLHRR